MKTGDSKHDKVKLGLKGILNAYSAVDFFKEAISPLIITFILCICIVQSNVETIDFIKIVNNIGLTALPTIMGLLIASFALVITIFLYLLDLDFDSEMLCHIIDKINASYSISLIVTPFTFVIAVVGTLVEKMAYASDIAQCINMAYLGLEIFLILFSFIGVIGIAIQLYNLCKTYILLKNSKDKS